MKQRVTREEVKERLVTDAYFQKGRSALKTRQTILTILAWLMVLVPFVWLAIPLTLPNLADRIAFRTYLEEAVTFDFLALFLGISFLVLVLTFTLLTLRNNRRFKRLLQKQSMHDEVALEKRKEVLEGFTKNASERKKSVTLPNTMPLPLSKTLEKLRSGIFTEEMGWADGCQF